MNDKKRRWLLESIAASNLEKDEIASKCGVSHRTLMSYVYGERGISLIFVKRLTDLLGIDITDVVRAEVEYIENSLVHSA